MKSNSPCGGDCFWQKMAKKIAITKYACKKKKYDAYCTVKLIDMKTRP